MPGLDTAVKVKGLREFQRGLKKLDGELPKALRVAFNEAADEIVQGTKSAMPRRSGGARGSVKAKSTQTKARVSEGGGRAPYVPWLDFGGRVGRRKQTRRPVSGDGRYLYPTYKSRQRTFQDRLSKALVEAGRRAGVEID